MAKSLTVEELVCACAGLPRKDVPLILEFEGKPALRVFDELASMKPTTGRRETFQYQNHMVAAAGFLAGHVLSPGVELNRAYAEAMKERVFEPLGMKCSTLDFKRAQKDQNHATPHSIDLEERHQKVKLAHEESAHFVAPSGGIWSSANEMALYLLNELAPPTQVGEAPRVASAANLRKRWEKQVAVSQDVH